MESGTPIRREPALGIDELRRRVAGESVDTVVLAACDLQGRLVGKRFDANFFLAEVVEHGTEACDYLLAVDVEMNTVDGYATSSWDTGYGDLVLTPDLATLRSLPWRDGSALLLADVSTVDGKPIAVAPRQVLRDQLAALAGHGLHPYVGTELEFCVYDDSYEDAWRRGYRDLTPANQYNADYSILATGRIEPLLREIRRGMAGAGMTVESAKGECNLGQHEIAFRYADALTTCDNHTIYKTGAKEIAAAQGRSLTFMAKPNAREGNSCHVHCSLRDDAGAPALAGDGEYGFGATMRQFLAGQLRCLPELTLLYAPNVNSYKRFRDGSFAPTAVRWGLDNRTCALRVVGHGDSLRVENRVPGGDVNPYLAVAAITAAGRYGIEHELALEPPCAGNAYRQDGARVPATLREAVARWRDSAVAHELFGADVVEHYAHCAEVELAAFDAAVTDWELYRGFERM
ncbi:glutamine synthetase family protein [Actinocatenispora comari]|uniref:Glutamine synthetase n=1 Tax=Actinocatenispora comari TaxID=2807577 RepID=A0A8J4A6Y2_9ACTN|nr:glutamine synthetase family protein [Actinocatenispora comari]GIL26171.1 glutamine synthetase [Actinocatenispora comari]